MKTIGRVVLGVVHEAGDAAAGHVFGGIGAQQGFQELRFEAVGLQPPLIMFRAENHRHPIVDGGDHRVGLGGDDGEGFDHLTDGGAGIIEAKFTFVRRADPFFPQTSHAEESALFAREPEGLFAGGCGLPLVKSVSRDQAALLFKRFPVAGFLADGVGAGVGELVADGFILGPRRDEAPAHGFQGGLAVFPDEDGRLLARGEVVARLKVHDLADEPDELFKLGEVLRDGVAAAHGAKKDLKLAILNYYK